MYNEGCITIKSKDDVIKYQELLKNSKNLRFRVEKLIIKGMKLENIKFFKDFINENNI